MLKIGEGGLESSNTKRMKWNWFWTKHKSVYSTKDYFGGHGSALLLVA